MSPWPRSSFVSSRWPWRRAVVVLGIDGTGVARAVGSLLHGGDGAVVVGHGAGGGVAPAAEALCRTFVAACDGERPATLQLRLGLDLCRHWVFEVPPGVRALAELQTLARARALQLFGPAPGGADAPVSAGDAGGWQVTAEWRGSGRLWCTAVPLAWLAAIRQAGHLAGLRLQAEPAAHHALSLLARAQTLRGVPSVALPSIVAWPTPGFLVLADGAPGSLRTWRCLRRPAPQEVAELVALAQAEAQALAAVAGHADALPGVRLVLPASLHAAAAEAGQPTLHCIDAPWSIPDEGAGSEAGWAAGLQAGAPGTWSAAASSSASPPAGAPAPGGSPGTLRPPSPASRLETTSVP